MTDEQILKKAIERAIENGFEPFWWDEEGLEIKRFEYDDLNEIEIWIGYTFEYNEDGDNPKEWDKYMLNIFELIFSHSFAKAFWGEEIIETYGWDKGNHDDNTERELAYFCYTYKKPAWKHHLQQMVLEEKPLKYIG